MKKILVFLTLLALVSIVSCELDVSSLKCVLEDCNGDPECGKALLRDIRDHNTNRRTKSRVAVALIYLFVSLGYVSMAFMASILLGWAWCPFSAITKRCTENQSRATQLGALIWFASSCCIVAVLTAGGVLAWMCFGFILFILNVGIGIMACLVGRRTPKVVPHELNSEEFGMDNMKPVVEWRELPLALGKGQVLGIIIAGALMLLFLAAVLGIFFGWSPQPYIVWDRASECQVEELIPTGTARALALMYSWNKWATNIRMGVYAKIATSYCGVRFTKQLSLSERQRFIKEDFIDVYKINMSIYTPSEWTAFPTVNEWFIRKVNPLYRQITSLDVRQIVAPADARTLIYPNLYDSGAWIKGAVFSTADILDVGEDHPMARLFAGGMMVISRLAPQDYHRFNSPANAATIEDIRDVKNSYWSVGVDAASSANKAFYNTRKVIVLRTPTNGRIAYIAIGATCVGSIVVGRRIGETVNIGDELGYMQFGGSTILMLFEAGRIRFDESIAANSLLPVETYTLVNSKIGTGAPL